MRTCLPSCQGVMKPLVRTSRGGGGVAIEAQAVWRGGGGGMPPGRGGGSVVLAAAPSANVDRWPAAVACATPCLRPEAFGADGPSRFLAMVEWACHLHLAFKLQGCRHDFTPALDKGLLQQQFEPWDPLFGHFRGVEPPGRAGGAERSCAVLTVEEVLHVLRVLPPTQALLDTHEQCLLRHNKAPRSVECGEQGAGA